MAGLFLTQTRRKMGYIFFLFVIFVVYLGKNGILHPAAVMFCLGGKSVWGGGLELLKIEETRKKSGASITAGICHRLRLLW